MLHPLGVALCRDTVAIRDRREEKSMRKDMYIHVCTVTHTHTHTHTHNTHTYTHTHTHTHILYIHALII